jgi:hypothetical protein
MPADDEPSPPSHNTLVSGSGIPAAAVSAMSCNDKLTATLDALTNGLKDLKASETSLVDKFEQNGQDHPAPRAAPTHATRP